MDNKTLIDTMSERLGISAGEIDELISATSGIIGECASRLDTVVVAGFGSFEPKKRLERVALHPASGKRLLIPPKIVLSFRPSAALKQSIKTIKKGGDDE